MHRLCRWFRIYLTNDETSVKLNPMWKLWFVISHENTLCFSLRRRAVHYIRALSRRYDAVEDHMSRCYVSGNTDDDMFR